MSSPNSLSFYRSWLLLTSYGLDFTKNFEIRCFGFDLEQQFLFASHDSLSHKLGFNWLGIDYVQQLQSFSNSIWLKDSKGIHHVTHQRHFSKQESDIEFRTDTIT
ncbi:hypothetical protein VNO77_18037 [Canavalia gladiata]|uniref:Uncharacterized protein n=1 Tax=Canavalia gladiata TaxID=3824 RepID=A0AAN9QJX6_CANGL